MTAAINLNQLARMSAESMLNCILEGIAIGLFAWIFLRLVGRRNSSTRFAVWFSALLAIAALPVLGIAASGSAQTGKVLVVTVPSSWAFDIFLGWAAVACVSLLRVGMGLLQLRKLRAGYRPIDAATLDPLLRATLQEFQAVRPVTLCQSDRLQVPTAIGFFRPVVVIPSWALQELSAAELNSILIHELAHLRRWDDWTNLAQQILKALLFFHPAVWWIEGQLALEREMACDDAVLAATGNPRGYAQCLVSMAEKSFMRRGLALAQAAVHRMRQTSLRVAQILDANRSGATQVWKPAVYSVAAISVVCLVSLSHAPELVAFKDATPDIAIASAIPANRVPTSATDSGFMERQANATGASFRPKPGVPLNLSSRDVGTIVQRHQIQEGRARSVATQNSDYRVRERASSPVPQSVGYQVGEGTGLLVSQYVEYRIWESASLLVPQIAENKSGLQPPGQGTSVEASSSVATPVQAILVVMRVAQYDEAGPLLWKTSVWRVTILDSSRQIESRIPAKQI